MLDTTIYTACIVTYKCTEYEIATNEFELKRNVLKRINTLGLSERERVENSIDYIHDGDVDFFDQKIKNICGNINVGEDEKIEIFYSKIDMTFNNTSIVNLTIEEV